MILAPPRRIRARTLARPFAAVAAASLLVLVVLRLAVRAALPTWAVVAYYRSRGASTAPLVAYQLNWKGENYYTGNNVALFIASGGSRRLVRVLARARRAVRTPLRRSLAADGARRRRTSRCRAWAAWSGSSRSRPSEAWT